MVLTPVPNLDSIRNTHAESKLRHSLSNSQVRQEGEWSKSASVTEAERQVSSSSSSVTTSVVENKLSDELQVRQH